MYFLIVPQSMLQVAKNLFTHLGEFCDVFERWRRFPPELHGLNANIDLYALCPLDRKDEDGDVRSDLGSADAEEVDLDRSSSEEVLDSFTGQDDEEESDEEKLSSPDSAKQIERRKRREKNAAPYRVPRSSEEKKNMKKQARPAYKLDDEWFDASSEDISLGDIHDEEAKDPLLKDLQKGVEEMGRDIGDDEFQTCVWKRVEDETLEALGNRKLDGNQNGPCHPPDDSSDPSRDQGGAEAFVEASSGEYEVLPKTAPRTKDSWGNVIYRPQTSVDVIQITGPTPENSPSRPNPQKKWLRRSSELDEVYTSRRHPFPTESECGRDLLRRQSSLVLELDWSCATLSVFSIPTIKAHLEDPCR